MARKSWLIKSAFLFFSSKTKLEASQKSQDSASKAAQLSGQLGELR
jgi:hypothetical protein